MISGDWMQDNSPETFEFEYLEKKGVWFVCRRDGGLETVTSHEMQQAWAWSARWKDNMETTWKQQGRRSPAHPQPQLHRQAEQSSRPTYELGDGVIRAGHCLDLPLQHSLPLSWERGKAMLGKAAVHLSTHLLTHGGQGFLQVKGARKHEVQHNCISYSLFSHF